LPEDIILGSYEVNPAYAGKNLAEIAKLENKTPARMLVELIARIDEWEKRMVVNARKILWRLR
jgi:hypothetical protein